MFIASRLDIGHHHSPTKMLRGSRTRLVADKLANGKEPKDGTRGCAIAIAPCDSVRGLGFGLGYHSGTTTLPTAVNEWTTSSRLLRATSSASRHLTNACDAAAVTATEATQLPSHRHHRRPFRHDRRASLVTAPPGPNVTYTRASTASVCGTARAVSPCWSSCTMVRPRREAS